MIHKNITFDETDKNLFQVDDARLRADALKHSVLPRLHAVMNECILTINEVYQIDILEDSIVTYFPHFRQKRDNELEHLYEAAFIGLGGKRTKDKWHGVQRKDGKPVQIVPFRIGFQLGEKGLMMGLDPMWLKGLSDASFEKYLDFHLEYEELTQSVCHMCEMSPILMWGDEVGPISPFKEHYEYMKENRLYNNMFLSVETKAFPISSRILDIEIWRFTLFFPIYDSYIQISKGEPVRFLELIDKANKWLKELKEWPNDEFLDDEDELEDNALSPEHSTLQAREAAEQRIKVMPAIRWQVFQRDNWKCVACGKGSQQNAILHVDHIIPRSKGGSNTLENYQTLCDICNIGKSNKDDTDLRHRT